MKHLLFTTIFIILSAVLYAQEPTTVSTFECISIYWSPNNGSTDKTVLVKFREIGTANWHEGLSMRYNPISDTDLDKDDYRGSIVNLTPDTEYEIELTLEGTATTNTLTATTWSEDFPIGQTITPGNLSSGLDISQSGTPDAYILIDGTDYTIDVNNNSDACITISGNYVIVRGYNLIGGRKYAIELHECHDVIIENCDMSNWGEEWKDGIGKNYQGAITSPHNSAYDYESVERIIVQRCRIHNPRYGSNSWAEQGANGNNHPTGPQAISLIESKGNHVFRYNEAWSSPGHYFNDIFGMLQNDSYKGFPGADSDIYGNYLANCWDDALELDGGNRNVRAWGNFSEDIYMHISNTGTAIGPLYVWGNVHGRSYSPPGSTYGEYAKFMKMGEAGFNMDGFIYVFNNTLININEDGSGGIGTSASSSGRYIYNTMSRNNILHVRNGKKSISTKSSDEDNDFDYDFLSGGYPSGHEQNGISGKPVYQSGFGFDYENMTANYCLASGSPGIDAGVVVPNFRKEYTGSAPDMGAFEAGQPAIEYGVHAYLPGPFQNYTLKIKIEGEGYVSPGDGAYATDSNLLVTAIADINYKFDHWSGYLSGTENPQLIKMDGNKNIEAVFVYSPVYDTIKTKTYGGGMIKFNPPGNIHLRGTEVEALAISASRRNFDKWGGDISGDENPIKNILDGSLTIEATFIERTGPVFLQPDNEDGLLSLEAENHQYNKNADSFEWITLDSPLTGASGDKYVFASPDFFYTILENIESTSPHIDFDIEFLKAERYYVWVRGYAEKDSDNSIYLGLDNMHSPDNINIKFEVNSEWNWSNINIDNAESMLQVSYAGIHTLNIWMRDDGAAVDKIVLTTNPDYVPTAMGPSESEQKPGLSINSYTQKNNLGLHIYPNPIRTGDNVQIKYRIEKGQYIELSVYDSTGKILSTLFSGNMDAGEHEVYWNRTNNDGDSLRSGIYFLRLKAGKQLVTQKMVVL